MLKPPVPQLIGGCADGRSEDVQRDVATNMVSVRPASDHASQVAVRALMPPIPRPCSLAPSVTPPLYSTTASRVLGGGNLYSNINLSKVLAATFFAPSATTIPAGGVASRTRMRERLANTPRLGSASVLSRSPRR